MLRCVKGQITWAYLRGSRMNFKEYLQLVEAMTLSAEDITLQDSLSYLKCSFRHNGDEYKVYMDNDDFEEISDVWSVNFDGPKGVSLTGKAGAASTIIYNKMLSCVKKLFELHEVNGLIFSEADPAMVVTYDLFYRNFLRPNPPRGAGFLKVSDYLYLSKHKIRELDYTNTLLAANRVRMAKVELVKINKAIGRVMERIRGGQAFPTDRKTLQDLEAKSRELEMKHAQTKRNHEAALQRRQYGGWQVVS